MTTPTVSGARVLLVDDDTDVHALVTAMLRPLGVTLEHAGDGAEALQRLRQAPVDLVLLDYEMPGRNGLDVLAELRADPRLSRLPVIMVTGSDSHAVLARCFADGAQDYLRKPFFAAELRARVGAQLERQQLLVELVGAARRDRLTGLPNRAFLVDQLQAAVREAKRSPDAAFALMFLDFDRFKVVNDSLGHEVGDQLLRSIAGRLRENLRASDTVVVGDGSNTVARLGGDEFVVVLPGVRDLVAASSVADRLIEVLEPPYQLGAHTVRSSASIGIACNTGQYDAPDDMLRDADIAMYEAKARGKGCWVVFSDAMRAEVEHRHTVETELRRAIEEESLALVYQPIVSLDDRSVSGVEALVRWTHPVLGDVPPSEFVPIAEETRLIQPMSEWILERACRDFAQWRAELGARAPRRLSVNLSRIQLGDPGLVDRVLAVLRAAGLEPGDLQLEVTESQIMANRTAAVAQLHALRAAGVRLAMDDFGTGYSSLSCLQEFPLHVLKIDRQFVANLRLGRDFAALVHAVITLADNLGLEVVAEGIEDVAQAAMLQDLGCRDGQGFLLARPMPADDLGAWLLVGARDDGGALRVTVTPSHLDTPHSKVA
jgi:diguanylate cyclase (GGDEF)-like protein